MRHLLVSLAVLACAAPVLAEDTPRPPPIGPNAPPDFYMGYSEQASLVRVVPLARGRLPDLTKGVELGPPWGAGVDATRPPAIVLVPDGDLLLICGPEWVRYRRDDLDTWRLRTRGAWTPGTGLIGVRDVDGDREPDLVLLRGRRPGDPGIVSVARGEPDGTFAPPKSPQQVVGTVYGVFFALGDVDEDGKLDLLFHEQDHGGQCPVRLFAAPGKGDGTWGEPRGLAGGPHGASSMAVVKLRPDQRPTILIGADDDLDDGGQTQVAIQDAAGAWSIAEGADLEPLREGYAHDEGYWTLTPVDLDLDGHIDLVARFDAWALDAKGQRPTRVQVLGGLPEGGFRTAEDLIHRAFPADAGPSLGWPAAPYGP